MAITLKDVASVAGVSTATVSRALAGSERVSPRTADHIRTIASDLGYRYDNVARALRQKRSNLVGMVAPDYGFPYARELLYALNQAFFRDEFVLAPIASFGSVSQELAQVERLLGQRIDALIITPVDAINSAEAIKIALEEDVTVIQLFRQVQHAETAGFQLDYVAGIDFALRSIGQGEFRSIVYIDDEKDFAGQGKLHACQHVMSRYAVDEFTVVPYTKSGTVQQASIEAAVTTLTSAQLPDMIICASDEALRVAAKSIDLVSAATRRRPVILSLDPIQSSISCASVPFVSLEFSMGAMARGILDCINAALHDGYTGPDTVLIRPFLNVSQL